MKKSVVVILLSVGIFFCQILSAKPVTGVDQRLLKTFADAYPAAEKISWSEKSGHYVVRFIDHHVLSLMEYDANAQVVQSIRYYSDPAMLPQNVSWQWHRQYSDKILFGITEVSDGKTTAWFLKGQNAKMWITVKASAEGGMQIVELFEKQL